MSDVNPQLLIESGGTDNMSVAVSSPIVFVGRCRDFLFRVKVNNDDHVGTVTFYEGVTQVADDMQALTTTVTVSTGVAAVTDTSFDETNGLYLQARYARTSGDGQLDITLVKMRNN